MLGKTTGWDEPATEDGIDLSAGDHADAVTDGGPDVPPDAEPDLKDVAAAARQAGTDSTTYLPHSSPRRPVQDSPQRLAPYLDRQGEAHAERGRGGRALAGGAIDAVTGTIAAAAKRVTDGVRRGEAPASRYPPAMAGRMTSVSPSPTGVSRPSRTRTSSSLR